MSDKPTVFLTYDGIDAPMVLNIARNHECEEVEISDERLRLMQFQIAKYLMMKAQMRGPA